MTASAWRPRGPLVLVGLIGVAFGALLVVLIRWPSAAESDLFRPTGAQWVAAEATPYAAERMVELKPVWAQPIEIIAPSWSGLVTSSHCLPGSTLSSGDEIVEVDGLPRTALATAIPLFRTLTENMSGPDVTALQEALADLGYSTDVNGTVDGATLRAWTEVIGASDGSLTAIDPNMVVWLPAPSIVVGECSVTVGAAAVPGASLASSTSQLVSVDVAGADTDASGEGRIIRLGEVDSPFPADGSLRSGAVFDSLAASPENASGDPIQASSLLAVPLAAVKVPASAIVTDVDGRSCVIAGPGSTPTAVEIVGSRLGLTFVVGDLVGGDAVLVAPPNGTRCSR